MTIVKPVLLSGRDREWRAATRFVENTEDGAKLGLVYGRRRQGKTFLLDLLAEATGGFMFTAVQQSGPQNLRMLGAAYARYLGLNDPVHFQDWEAAVDALLLLGERRGEPTVVVLDEFPFLLDADPALPSLLQIGIGPTGRAFRKGRTRLILCGSALTTMQRLLLGTAPLRGRALMELVMPPFGFREAAEFWGLAGNPDLAFSVNALVGGTPAYRAMCGGTPEGDGLDEWVANGLLDPTSAIFREGNVLLYEQPDVSDPSLYFSVLGAVADGAAKRSEIAGLLGRPDSALSHPLAVLQELRLVARVEDALRPRHPIYQLTEPVIRFQQLLIRPREATLAARGGLKVWHECADTVTAKIYGPHLEDIAREWVLAHAAAQTLGGEVTQVRPATIACREHKAGHELDVVAMADLPHQPTRVLAIGEVKATQKTVGHGELTRLEHLRDLLPSDKVSGQVKLLLFSRSGFTAEIQKSSAGRGDVELIDLPRLYHGD
jgi:uncharacterized protein